MQFFVIIRKIKLFCLLINILYFILIFSWQDVNGEKNEVFKDDIEFHMNCLMNTNLPIDERWEAIRSIIASGKLVVPPLVNLLRSNEEKGTVNLTMVALGEIGDNRAIDAIGKILLENTDEDIQVAAALTLGKFKDKIADGYLLQKLKMTRDKQGDYSIIRYEAKDFINSPVLKSNCFLTKSICSGWQDVSGIQLETVVADIYLEFNFIGTGCDILAYNDVSGAILLVTVDNEISFDYNQFSKISEVKRFNLCKDLPYGKHNIKFQKIGGWPYSRVNAFEVYLSKNILSVEDEDSRIVKNASDDKFIKGAVIVSLGRLQYKESLPFLIEKLTQDMFYIRRLSVWAIGNIGDTSSVPVLLSVLSNKEEELMVRLAAIESLERIGKVEMIPTLEKLNENEENVMIKTEIDRMLSQLSGMSGKND